MARGVTGIDDTIIAFAEESIEGQEMEESVRSYVMSVPNTSNLLRKSAYGSVCLTEAA